MPNNKMKKLDSFHFEFAAACTTKNKYREGEYRSTSCSFKFVKYKTNA